MSRTWVKPVSERGLSGHCRDARKMVISCYCDAIYDSIRRDNTGNAGVGRDMADRRLQVFHAVAKQSSFTKAAETLFMTQPAVTFQIKQLEEHFNTRLFDRGHGKISLTPAGEVVLEYAERILSLSAELDTRISELTGEVQGLLLIGASMTIAEFMLPRILLSLIHISEPTRLGMISYA